MRIQVLKKRRAGAPSSAAIRMWLAMMLAVADENDAELSVTFVGDEEMASLNGQYRGKNHTTDVLAFPQREGEFPEMTAGMLGDVVISLDTAKKQAEKAGHSLDREIAKLLAHGLCHLLGCDHEKGKEEARAMRRMEKKLLASL